MKNNLFLLCMLAPMVCTSGVKGFESENNEISKTNNVIPILKANNHQNNDVYYTPNGIAFDISCLGKPIDLVKSNVSRPNFKDIKQNEHVFEEEWLKTKYDEACTGTNITIPFSGVDSMYSSGSTVKEITDELTLNINNYVSIDASYACYEAGITSSFNTTSSTSQNVCNSHMYVQYRVMKELFNVGLPSIGTNTALYSAHTSAGYNAMINDIVIGRKTWFDVFSRFGTHILGSANYGGTVDYNFDAYTNKTVFSKEDATSFKNTIKGQGTYEGIDFDFVDELNTYVANTYKINIRDVHLSVNSQFRGGPDEYCIPPLEFDDYGASTVEWLKHIKEQPCVIAYTRAIPIWEYVPDNIPNRTAIIQDAISSFNEYKKEGEYVLTPEVHLPFTRTIDLQSEGQEDGVHCGVFNDVDVRLRTFNIDYRNAPNLPSLRVLKKNKYDTLRIRISGEVKDEMAFASQKWIILTYKHSQNVGYNASTTNREILSEQFYEGNHFSNYTYFEKYLSFNIEEEGINIFNSILEMKFRTFPIAYFIIGGGYYLRKMKIDFDFSSSPYED